MADLIAALMARTPAAGPSAWFQTDRKSTRLNSSHSQISYAVFCLKKKSKRLNSSHSQISYAVFCLKKKNTNTHIKHFSITHDKHRHYTIINIHDILLTILYQLLSA